MDFDLSEHTYLVDAQSLPVPTCMSLKLFKSGFAPIDGAYWVMDLEYCTYTSS